MVLQFKVAKSLFRVSSDLLPYTVLLRLRSLPPDPRRFRFRRVLQAICVALGGRMAGLFNFPRRFISEE